MQSNNRIGAAMPLQEPQITPEGLSRGVSTVAHRRILCLHSLESLIQDRYKSPFRSFFPGARHPPSSATGDNSGTLDHDTLHKARPVTASPYPTRLNLPFPTVPFYVQSTS